MPKTKNKPGIHLMKGETLGILDEPIRFYYWHIRAKNGRITANAGFIGETEDEEDAIFKKVTDALNNSGIDFHSENPLELTQHLEIEGLGYEIEGLKAKVDRYEAALRIIQKWQLPPTGKFWDVEQTQPMSYSACCGSNGERDFMRNVANQALSAGEGKEGNDG